MDPKIVCTKAVIYYGKVAFTIGKVYETNGGVIGDDVFAIGDQGESLVLFQDEYVTLEQFREQQLDKLIDG